MPLCICVQPHGRTHQSKPPKQRVKSHCGCTRILYDVKLNFRDSQKNSNKCIFTNNTRQDWEYWSCYNQQLLEYSLLSIRAQSNRTPAILLQGPFILHMDAAILSLVSRWECVWVKSVVSGNEWVCEGRGSREFPVRSKWAGQSGRIKPGLCSVALYMAPLFLLFPHPFF